MGILNIREVKRGGAKALIAICGVSGSGKTYTAIQIASGMVSDNSKIGFLDTENKRGSLYADILSKPFMIGDLYAPFSPKRYAEAIKEFQDAGIEVLIIDSVSHEWEGEGGCDDIAQAPIIAGRKIANWVQAKSEHKKFMNALLQCDMHVILCVRAREKTDFKDISKPVSLGLQPVCEKNFMFEMMASMLMSNEGKNQQFIKMPSYLKEAFGDGNGYLGASHGKKLKQWLDEGEKESKELSGFKSEMMMACELGTENLRVKWSEKYATLTESDKVKAKKEAHVYAECAKSYDEITQQQNTTEESKYTV